MKASNFVLLRKMAKSLHPTVKNVNNNHKGILYGVTLNGRVRVRPFSTKTVITYEPDIWEFDPKQEMEQKLIKATPSLKASANKTPAKKASKKAAKKRRTKK